MAWITSRYSLLRRFATAGRSSASAAAIVLMAGITGCGDRAEDTNAWLGTDTVSGHEWRFTEELRIGSMSGEGPDAFGEIAAIGVSPDSLIHVLDAHDQQVRVFDQDGRFVRAIGRRGSGPGEFQGGFGLAWDSAGNLWVVDAQNGRYSVFDPSGNFLEQHIRRVPGVAYPWLGGFGADGHLYDVAPLPAADGSARFVFYRVDLRGQLVDSLAPIVQPPRARSVTLSLFALSPRVTFRFDPRGYLWHGSTGEYRLVQRSLQGDTVRIVERDEAPLAVSAEEAAAIRAELDSLPLPMRAEGSSEIPRVKPLFERIHVDAVGNLLVQRLGAVREQGRSFDIFDADGRFLGTVESPVPFSTYRALPLFVGDFVYGVTTDSLGVDYLIRARIHR